MKKNVKLFAALLALVMMLGMLAACNGGGADPTDPPEAGASEPGAAPSEPAAAPSEPDEPGADALDRAELAIPDDYTKVKIFFGSYGFGDAEITAAMNDDESAFYLTFVCFDEDQIVMGTVNNGIAMVSFDKTGFMSADAQILYEDALAAEDAWHPLTGTGPAAPTADAPAAEAVSRAEYGIPDQYTKVKTFFGSYGFGDAEIMAAMNDDESAFYLLFVCFDEDQIVEGTVKDGIAMVSFDKTGFMSADAQILYEDALAAEEAWAPLE